MNGKVRGRPSISIASTFKDIDIKNKTIDINHQLQRKRNMKYVVVPTKTTSGTRVIPMTEEVLECFKRIIKNRNSVKKEPMVDGDMYQ